MKVVPKPRPSGPGAISRRRRSRTSVPRRKRSPVEIELENFVWPRVVACFDHVHVMECLRCGRHSFVKLREAGEFTGVCAFCGCSKASRLIDTGKRGWWAFDIGHICRDGEFDKIILRGMKGPYDSSADAIIEMSRDLGLISLGPVARA